MIVLSVPFSQKNEAKALGAKWNPNITAWVIADDADQSKFSRWLPKSVPVNQSQAISTDSSEFDFTDTDVRSTKNPSVNQEAAATERHQTLSEFMGKVSEVVRRNFMSAQWVQLEVSKVSDRSAHVYMDFVEYNETGKEIAKARGSLWASKKNAVLGKFRQATGGDVKDGMKLLLLLKAEFSAQFGFSFVIEDIDPAYTLGDMQAKMRQIRETLKKEGLYEANRQLGEPKEFTQVAVISPESAAGLADFMREAESLQGFNLCDFHYFTATFQGKSTQSSVLGAINQVLMAHARIKFDAVVIIRGGGAASDLAWLNDYEIAKSVCRIPAPVFTGIGHQIDDTILDEISFRRFDTPSKVSAYIASVIVNNANEAIQNTLSLIKDSARAITYTESKLNNLMSNIRASSMQVITAAEQKMEHLMGNVRSNSMQIVARYEAELPAIVDQIRAGAENTIAMTGQKMQSMMTEIIGLSPKKTLERGYAVVRDGNGKPITTSAKVKEASSIKIELRDGVTSLDIKH